MHPRVGRDGAPHVDPDRRRVDELHRLDARGVYCLHMRRPRALAGERLQGRDQALEHQRGLSGSGDAGYGDEAPLREVNRCGLYRMYPRGLKMDSTETEHPG